MDGSLALCSAGGHLPRLELLSVTCHHLNRGHPHPAAEFPSFLQCDVQVHELTEDDWGSIPDSPSDDLKELQQIIEPLC